MQHYPHQHSAASRPELNQLDVYGNSPLDLAIGGGNSETVNLLKQHGCRVFRTPFESSIRVYTRAVSVMKRGYDVLSKPNQNHFAHLGLLGNSPSLCETSRPSAARPSPTGICKRPLLQSREHCLKRNEKMVQH